MGNALDSLFSNSKEREFKKNLLSDKKINDLVIQKPNFNVEPVYEPAKILERPDEEKILRGMTGQKIFNIKGDSIFEYYFTHHRNEIRNCMKSHINRVNTPCPDENFNKMIKTIPDLVLGPLEEKQSQWNTEKDSLEKQWDSDKQKWDTEKNTLQTQWDSDKQKWDTEKNTLQTQWDTEKDSLEKQLETLGNEKKAWIDRKKQLEFDVGSWRRSYETTKYKWKKEVEGLKRINKYDKEQCDINSYRGAYDRLKMRYDDERDEWFQKKEDYRLKVEELENQKNSLQEQYNNQRGTMNTRCNSEKNSMQNQFNEEKNSLQNNLNTLQEQHNNLKSNYDNLDGQNNNNYNLYQQEQEKNTALQNNYNSIKIERDNLSEGCGIASQTLTKEKANLQKQLKDINEEKNILLKEKERLKKIEKQLKEELVSETQKKVNFIEKNNNLEKEKKAWIERKKKLEFDVGSWRRSYETTKYKWKKEVEGLKRINKYDKEQCDIKSYRGAYDRLKMRYDDERDEWFQKKEDYRLKAERLEDQIGTLRNQKNSLQEQYNNQRGTMNTRCNSEKNSMKNQFNEEKDSMQNQFNKEKKELQKKYNILENKYYEVEGDYKSAAKDYSNCNWHRSKEARTNWKQQEKYDALKKKYDLIQSERDNFNENCDSASQKGSVTKENSNLRKQLDEIEKKLKLQKHFADARSQALIDLMPEMERQYETIARLENQLKNC
jgi:hypothetical protein